MTQPVGELELPSTSDGRGKRWTAAVLMLAFTAVAVGVVVVSGWEVLAPHVGVLTAHWLDADGAAPAEPVTSGRPGSRKDAARRGETAKAVAHLPASFRRVARQVAQARGLNLREPVRAHAVSSAELGSVAGRLALAELDFQGVRQQQTFLQALRLLPPGYDLLDVGSGSAVGLLGLYDARRDVMYVLDDHDRGRLSPRERSTMAHELTHALQDQAYDLAALYLDVPDRDPDMALARSALIEGDAMLSERLWGEWWLAKRQRERILDEELRALANAAEEATGPAAPRYLVDSLIFRYQAGHQFVYQVYRREGFAGIDRLYGNPPTTTEQILHPDRYFAGEVATPVAVPHSIGPWRRGGSATLGEFDLVEMLLPLGHETAVRVGTGWGGGRIGRYRRGKETAVLARVSFDTVKDARQLCHALPRWYARVADGGGRPKDGMKGDRDAFARTCRGRQVTFAFAGTDRAAAGLIR